MLKCNINAFLYIYISNVFNSRRNKVLLPTKLNILIIVS